MSTTKTYDPTKVCLSVGGLLISGYADGSMIKAERNQDTFKLIVGGDGAKVRSKSPDKSGKVTITLLQSSGSNATLSALAITDEQTGAGMVPVLIKDLNGATLWEATEAWIQKPTAGSWDKEAKDREWVLECAELGFFEGGF